MAFSQVMVLSPMVMLKLVLVLELAMVSSDTGAFTYCCGLIDCSKSTYDGTRTDDNG